MAKLTGNLGFTDTLGNISAYKSRNSEGTIVRTKGGPSGKKVKHDPAFENTRRNNHEFGGASSAAKALRDGLSIFDLMVTFSSNHKVTFSDVLNNLHILDYDYYFKMVDGKVFQKMDWRIHRRLPGRNTTG